MKIISKQTLTTVIYDDGSYSDLVKKQVVITDDSFESLGIDDLHEIISRALKAKVVADSQGEESR